MKILTEIKYPHQTLSLAAQELGSYLEQMLRAEPGQFVVSLDVQSREGNDAFQIAMTTEGGTITGNNPRSVLLGVYDYLHHLGCRFLTPVKETEVIPRINRDQLPARYEKQASFQHRGVCIEGADSAENVLDFIQWLPKAGYNSFFLQFKVPYEFLARWYHHLGNPLREPEPFTVDDAQTMAARFEQEMARRSLLLHKAGHGWTGEVLGSDTTGWNAVDMTLAPDKKELAALFRGKRDLFNGIPVNTNLCFSNPKTVDAFADLVVDYARRNPGVDYLHVWLADAFNNVCECDKCRKTTISDQYVSALNEIDRRLSREGLAAKIVFLLYQELLWPPIRQRLTNPDRFLLMFAPISRTFEASYDLSQIPGRIPEYVFNQITLPTSLGENLAFLKGWQACFPGEGFVFDYPLGRAHYGDFGYLHIARIIGQDVKKLHSMGLDGYISCQELRVASPNMVPNYVMGAVLFDENADVEARIREYFESAYPGDSQLARVFLEQLSALSSCDYLNGKGPQVNPDMSRRMGEITALCLRMEEPLQHTPDTPHWNALRHHNQYIRHLSSAMEALASGDDREMIRRYQQLRLYICRTEPEFQSWLDVYRILEITKNHTGFRHC